MSTVLPEIATPHNAPRNTTLGSAGSIGAWLPHVAAICDPGSRKNAIRIFPYDSYTNNFNESTGLSTASNGTKLAAVWLGNSPQYLYQIDSNLTAVWLGKASSDGPQSPSSAIF